MAATEVATDNAYLEDIRKIARSFFEAWNHRNVKTIAPLFTQDAEVVNSLGLWWRGLTEVTQGLETMNSIGPSLTPDSISARLVTPDAAVCIVTYTVGSFTRPDGRHMPEQKAISTFFLVNPGPGWRIAGAQTTAVNHEIIAQVLSPKPSGA